jgi:hypothetical protein
VGVGGALGGPVGAGVGGLVGLGYGALFGGDDDKAKKALLAKQKQMAAEFEARAKQQHQESLQGLSQQAMAFAPRNQMMAQMFGADAAFTPQQFADMTSDPGAKSLEEATANWNASAMQNPIDPVTRSRTRGAMNPQVQADLERARENERRKQWLMQRMGPTPQGPAPIQMPTPQRGRK